MHKLGYGHVVVVRADGESMLLYVAEPGLVLELLQIRTGRVDRFQLSGLDAEGRLVYRPETPTP